MSDGEYHKTKDAILVDEFQANSKEEAINVVLKSEKQSFWYRISLGKMFLPVSISRVCTTHPSANFISFS